MYTSKSTPLAPSAGRYRAGRLAVRRPSDIYNGAMPMIYRAPDNSHDGDIEIMNTAQKYTATAGSSLPGDKHSTSVHAAIEMNCGIQIYGALSSSVNIYDAVMRMVL